MFVDIFEQLDFPTKEEYETPYPESMSSPVSSLGKNLYIIMHVHVVYVLIKILKIVFVIGHVYNTVFLRNSGFLWSITGYENNL